MNHFLVGLGRGVLTEFRRVVSYATLAWVTFMAVFERRAEGRRVVWGQAARQIIFTGLDAVWLVGFLGAVGSIVTLTAAFTYFGGAEENRMVTDLLLRLLVREVAPFITAVIVALRSGSAITVELGYMSARGEVEGIETVGIDPVRLLLVPRFTGMVVSTVGLNLVFISAVFTAAFGTAVQAGLVPARMSVVWSYAGALQPFDVAASLAKAALFGVTTAAVVCYHGLSVGGDVTEMPRRVARALVEVVIHCTVLASVLALISL